jgi:hypothetical protein
MDRRVILALVALVVIIVAGGSMLYFAYYNSFYAMNRADALFNRAETAGFAEDMIAYLQRGRVLLPKSGNPVWWFPTDKTDFGEIQHDIDGIIARATILENLPRNSTAYQTGMNDLRGRTKALELQVADASGYLFVSGWNVIAAAVWLAIFAIIAFLVKRR